MKNTIKYLAIPYVHAGRDPQSGLDCWGLVYYFYKEEFNIHLPRYDLYDSKKNTYDECASYLTSTDIYKNFDIVPHSKEDRNFNNVQYGDIIVFNIGGNPVHTGVVIDKNMMLHTMDGRESIIERFTDHKWITRLRSIHRANF